MKVCRPVAERRIGLQPGAAASPSAQTGHFRRCAGFVEEDQAMDLLEHVPMSSFARNFAASLRLESNLPNISHPSKKGALVRASLGHTQQIIDRELGVANANQLSRECMRSQA
jgi:hypothetical protein